MRGNDCEDYKIFIQILWIIHRNALNLQDVRFLQRTEHFQMVNKSFVDFFYFPPVEVRKIYYGCPFR